MSAPYQGPVVFLMGPTASGKTDVALWLAERLPVRLVSVDSALVYRGMDIGTAKPPAEVRARHPHHLVDIRDPSEPYSAAEFREDALAEIAAARAAGVVPLLVGGTMLYFRALRDGLAQLPPADPQIRARLDAEAAEHGLPALHDRLARVDPVTAGRLRPTDRQRLQRALEVFESTGVPLSAWHAQHGSDPLTGPLLQFALLPESRAWLRERISTRFHAMLTAGFEDEVRALHARADLHPGLPAMRSVGYRQLLQWLAGECSRDEAVRRAIVATGQLAKRQLTWLRGWEGGIGIPVDGGTGADRAGVRILREIAPEHPEASRP